MRLELEERNGLQTQAVISPLPVPAREETPQPAQGAVQPAQAAMGSALHDLLWGTEGFEARAAYQRTGNGHARVVNVLLLRDGQPCNVFDFGDRVTLIQVVRFQRTLENVNVSYKVRTPQGIDVVYADTRVSQSMSRRYLEGRTYVFQWTFGLRLMHGNYCVMTGVTQPPAAAGADWTFLDIVPFCHEFKVTGRRDGMVDGLVVWDNELLIHALEDEQPGMAQPAVRTAAA
jgi:hypothetical protein